MGDTMLRRTGEVIVQSDLHGPTNFTKCTPMRMEHFKEMNAERCLRWLPGDKGMMRNSPLRNISQYLWY